MRFRLNALLLSNTEKMRITILLSCFLILTSAISCGNDKTLVIKKWENDIPKKTKIWIDKEEDSYRELTYYEDGQIQSDKRIIKGEPHTSKYYFPTGEVSGLLMYHKGEMVLGAEYHKNGQPLGILPQTVDGKINGIANYFYADGTLRGQIGYLNNQATGYEKNFDSNGIEILDSTSN